MKILFTVIRGYLIFQAQINEFFSHELEILLLFNEKNFNSESTSPWGINSHYLEFYYIGFQINWMTVSKSDVYDQAINDGLLIIYSN